MSATEVTPKNMQIIKTVCSIERPSEFKRSTAAMDPRDSAL
jgi:hypothetical protein